MGATIYDVARHSGVSISTVSRVLNSPQTVNVETRQKVLGAIDTLSFVPRADASARARKATYRIGVLSPFFSYLPSFSQRLRGITSALSNTVYELVIYNANTAEHVHTYLENLPVTRRIDGLIVMSILVSDEDANRVVKYQFPTVMIETSHPLLSGIEIDNIYGGKLAATHLIRKGHRRIGFVGGDNEVSLVNTPRTSSDRLQGFCLELRSAGLEMPDEYIQYGSYRTEDGYVMTQRLLDLPERPTAIFAASDMLALGVLKAARERQIAVPGELAVIGFDDLEIADYLGLTTISQSLDDSGRVAVDLLLGRLSDESRPVQHVRLPMRVIERQTT